MLLFSVGLVCVNVLLLNPKPLPLKFNVFVYQGQIFEAEGEIKFSPVYRHIVLPLSLPRGMICSGSDSRKAGNYAVFFYQFRGMILSRSLENVGI